jgi:uncharacterized membrane protein YjjP (DUF1212 family)
VTYHLTNYNDQLLFYIRIICKATKLLFFHCLIKCLEVVYFSRIFNYTKLQAFYVVALMLLIPQKLLIIAVMSLTIQNLKTVDL